MEKLHAPVLHWLRAPAWLRQPVRHLTILPQAKASLVGLWCGVGVHPINLGWLQTTVSSLSLRDFRL